MTDFDFEVKSKKELARSAKYKVNGSKSKKCTLATDYMTQAQIKRMNGDTVSFNINRPMTLKEFKKIPPAAGKEYILRLVDIYGCNYTTIAKMFGCGRATCSRLLSSAPYEITFSRGSAMTREKRKQWGLFLAGEFFHVEEESEAEAAPESAAPPDEPMDRTDEEEPDQMIADSETEPRNMKMDRFSLCFSGRLSVEAIANSLRLMLGDGLTGSLRIDCSLDSNIRE